MVFIFMSILTSSSVLSYLNVRISSYGNFWHGDATEHSIWKYEKKFYSNFCGMLVRKPTSNWKVSDKKQTNKQTKPNAN